MKSKVEKTKNEKLSIFRYMKTIRFSVVIFYKDWKVLLQDRRNLWKDAIEWWWFGWQKEWDETPMDTAIREIKEETNITLSPRDLSYLGKVTKEEVLSGEIKEWNIFCVLWRDEFDQSFRVLEWAWSEWMTPTEMGTRRIYETQRVHLSIFENFLQSNHA